MATKPHKECYGTMFPSPLKPHADSAPSGKAFSVAVVPAYGLMPTTRHVDVDLAQWDDCLVCSELDSCQRLCTIRLSLESALS